jgi:hypothetical protein
MRLVYRIIRQLAWRAQHEGNNTRLPWPTTQAAFAACGPPLPRCRQPQPYSWVVWPLEHRLSYLAYLLLSSEPMCAPKGSFWSASHPRRRNRRRRREHRDSSGHDLAIFRHCCFADQRSTSSDPRPRRCCMRCRRRCNRWRSFAYSS